MNSEGRKPFEISFLEREVDFLSQKYGASDNLQSEAERPTSANINVMVESGGRPAEMKNSKLGESTFHNKPQLSTFLNTLNTTTDKQSVVSVPNQQDSFLLSKINPKELTNSELEYVLKNNKLPEKYITKEIKTDVDSNLIKTRKASDGSSSLVEGGIGTGTFGGAAGPKKTPFTITSPRNPPPGAFLRNFEASRRGPDSDIFPYEKGGRQKVPGVNSSIENLVDYHKTGIIEESHSNNNTPLKSQLANYNNLSSHNLSNKPQLNRSYSGVGLGLSSSQGPSTALNSSKAYAGAMNALQEKIKLTERELEFQDTKCTTMEKQYLAEKQKWQMQITQEITKANEMERKLRTQLSELEHTNELLKTHDTERENEILYTKRQMNILENEKNRHLEQNINDREGWDQDKDKLLLQINELSLDITNLKNEKAKIGNEFQLAKSKLREIDNVVVKLREQNTNEITLWKNRKSESDSLVKTIKDKLTVKIEKLKNENKILNEKTDGFQSKYDAEMNRKKNTIISLRKSTENQRQQIGMLKEQISNLQTSKILASHRSESHICGISGTQKRATKSPGRECLRCKRAKENEELRSNRDARPKTPGRGRPKGAVKYTAKSPGILSNRNTNIKNKSRSRSKNKSKSKGRRAKSVDKRNKTDTLSESNVSIRIPTITSVTELQSPERRYQTELTTTSFSDTMNYHSKIDNYIEAAPSKTPEMKEISEDVVVLEREIADLNRKYRQLLPRTKEALESSEMAQLRGNLSSIAQLLEEKSDKLFQTKKQQQIALRSII